MKLAIARAMMALAAHGLGETRRTWGIAMLAEFDAAADAGQPLRFAAGCLIAAMRELPRQEEGRFALASYALALGVMLPMASVQLGAALFGLPYLFPGAGDLPGALLEGSAHEGLIRGVYQAASPAIIMLLLTLAVGHFCIAWSMIERDWDRVRRLGTLALAGSVTLILFMAVLFLDSSRIAVQTAVLVTELATLRIIVERHAQLFPAAAHADHPG